MALLVVAEGEGHPAQALIYSAQTGGVPLNKTPQLVQLLIQLDLDLGLVIPPELYAVAAQVLVWAYSVDQRPVTGDRPAGAAG